MTDGMTFSEYIKAKELIKKLGEAYNAYYDTSRGMPYDIDTTIRESAMCIENYLNEIHRLIAENQRLLQKLQQAQAENERFKKILGCIYTPKIEIPIDKLEGFLKNLGGSEV